MGRLGMVVASVLGLEAVAHARPLLVVVEASGGCEPAALRTEIALALGRDVVGPEEKASDAARDLLVVTADARRLGMTYRPEDGRPLSRSVELDPSKPACATKAGLLAGDLVREEAAADPVTERETVNPWEQLPQDPFGTRPRVVPAQPVVAVAATARAPAPPSEWFVTVAAGPALGRRDETDESGGDTLGTGWRFELHRLGGEQGNVLYGLALETGPGPGHLVGIAGFGGFTQEIRPVITEVTLGLGLEASRLPGGAHGQLVPLLFARASGGLGVRLFAGVDLVWRLGVHAAASGHFSERSYIDTTLGLRLQIP